MVEERFVHSERWPREDGVLALIRSRVDLVQTEFPETQDSIPAFKLSKTLVGPEGCPTSKEKPKQHA
jgi:hypothetical protein